MKESYATKLFDDGITTYFYETWFYYYSDGSFESVTKKTDVCKLFGIK